MIRNTMEKVVLLTHQKCMNLSMEGIVTQDHVFEIYITVDIIAMIIVT
jgi:hypothetical protein